MVKKLDIKNFYKNKKILITGHTGFKGSWLSFWLINLGSKVIGLSDRTITKNSFLNNSKIRKKITNYKADIRYFNNLKKIILREKPDIIFHLAAQAIVSESYQKPLETISTNTLGSINVLHAASLLKKKNYLHYGHK